MHAERESKKLRVRERKERRKESGPECTSHAHAEEHHVTQKQKKKACLLWGGETVGRAGRVVSQ